MLASEMQNAANVWQPISQILFVPQTLQDYLTLLDLLHNLVEEVGGDETHPLSSLREVVDVLVEKYEDEYIPELTQRS